MFNRDGSPTAEEILDHLPKSKTQTATEFVGIGVEIFGTGKIAGSIGRKLAAVPGSVGRVGGALELAEPTKKVTTGQALLTEAAVGLPSDVVGAIREKDLLRVPVGVVLGATLGTALRPKIRSGALDLPATNSFEFSVETRPVRGFRTPKQVTRAGTEARPLQDITITQRGVGDVAESLRALAGEKVEGDISDVAASLGRAVAEERARPMELPEPSISNRPDAGDIATPKRAAIRDPAEGETITDLFGEKGVTGGPDRGKLFEFEPDRTLAGSEGRAREVVSALEGKVTHGTASEAELAQYQDAVSFLNRDEAIAEAEIKTRATGDDLHDPLAGDLFDENAPVSAHRFADGTIQDGQADFLNVDAINGLKRGDDFVPNHELIDGDPKSFDEVIAARKRDLKARSQTPPSRQRLQVLSAPELETKWRQYKRWLAKEDNATAGKEDERVIEIGGKGSGGDKIVAGEKRGMNARGRRTMARRAVAEAESEMRARGLDLPEEKTIWSDLTQADVQAANKKIVGRGGAALREATVETLTQLQREAEETLLKDNFDFTMSERWALIENELQRRGELADKAGDIMGMQPGMEPRPTSPLQGGFNPLDSELQFLGNRPQIQAGDAPEVPSRSDMIDAIASVVGMKPGIGKSNVLRKALGFFRIVPQDIRLRNANDVEVYTHEIGHMLHYSWFGGTEIKTIKAPPKGRILPPRKRIRLNAKALDRFADELGPLGEGVSDGSTSEGWAEFWRLFVTNEEAARRLAPRTMKYVEDRLAKEHDLRNVLLQVRDDHRAWVEGSSEARHMAHTAFTPKPKQINVADGIQAMREAVLDELTPWQRLQDNLLGQDPIDIKDAAADLARLVRGAFGTGEHFLEHGTLDANTLDVKGRGLVDILEDLYFDDKAGRTFKSQEVRRQKLQEFTGYWESRRDLEHKLKGLKTGFQTFDSVSILRKHHPEIPDDFWQRILDLNDNPSPRALEAYRETLRTSPSGGVNRGVFDSIQQYRTELLEYGRDLGLFSKEELEQMLTNNTEYAPFYRDFGDEASSTAGGARQGQLGRAIKKFKGSERRIINPLESLISDTYRFTAAAHRQEVSNALIRLSRTEGAGKFLSQVTPGQVGTRAGKDEVLNWVKGNLRGDVSDQFDDELLDELFDTFGDALPDYMMIWRPGDFFGKDNIVSFINPDTQKREWFEVLDRELYESLMGLDRQDLHWFAKLASVPARTLRAGATLALEFAARNPIRDNIAAAVQSEFGFTPGVDLMRGLFEMTGGGSDLYWKWKAAGGERAALVDMDRPGMRKALDMFTHTGGVKNVLTEPMQALGQFEDFLLGPLRKVSSLSEDATRLGEFRNAVEALEQQGFKGRELYQRAALAAREVSVDFARHGTKTTAIRHMAAFWNARLQGYDRLFRAFQKNPAQATAKSLTWITLPTIANFLANKDDPEYWQLPRWQRDFFWMVKAGDTWLRIPKPFELGLMFGTMVERVLEWHHLEDPDSLNSLLGVPMPRINAEGFAAGSAPLFDTRDFVETASKNPLAVDLAAAFMPIPTAVQPLVENYFNYSIFLQRPIVSRSLEGRSDFLQSTARTTDLAKGFGRLFGTSPAKMDNLLFAYTGGLGRTAGELVTGARELGSRTAPGLIPAPEIPRDRFTDLPVIREITSAFTARNPGSSSLAMEDFYAAFEEASTAQDDVKALEERGDRGALRVYRQQNRDLLRSWRRLSAANERIKPLRSRLRSTQSERRDTPEGKRARDDEVKDLGRRMTNEALRGLDSSLPRLPR